jgi:hypothetical protein
MSYLREPIYWVDKEAETKARDVFMNEAGFNRDLAGLMAKFCAPRIKLVPFVVHAGTLQPGLVRSFGNRHYSHLIERAKEYNVPVQGVVSWLPEPLFAIWNTAHTTYNGLLPLYRSELFLQTTVENIQSLQQYYSCVERAFREFENKDEAWQV